jgi:hypothetical protein
MTDATSLHSSRDFLVFKLDNVFGVVIGRELEMEDFAAIKRHADDIVSATANRGHCVYIYYAAGLAIPSMPFRRAAAELTQSSGHVKLLARAFVVPGSGFWASAMQGIYVATTALSPTRFPQRFCATDVEAARFLAPHTGMTESDLARAFDRARVRALGLRADLVG